LFILWAMAVAALSVISYPGSNDLLMSVKLTSSGFVVHGVAYFLGISLCYFSFTKKKDRDQRSEIRRQTSEDGRTDDRKQMSEIRRQTSEDGRTEDGDQISDVRRQMSGVAFVVWAGLLIFLFSVVLEAVQFYLPNRTFNWYDVVANACGVLLFGVWILFISHGEGQRLEVRGQMSDDTPVKSAAL